MGKIFIVIAIIAVLAGTLIWRAAKDEVLGPEVRIGDDVFSVEVAATPEARERGLAGRPPIPGNRGMLFLFDAPDLYGFWMRGMQFPIDIVWIRDNRIVGFIEEVPTDAAEFPPVYRPPTLVDRVLEVRAGEVARRGIRVGEEVEILLR